jgi:archaetidylinositol phosphate synthase
MPKRVSYSLLDPYLSLPLKGLYPRLPISRRLPPEAIVACGHLSAIAGAVGMAFSTTTIWGGVLAALGVAANHACDVLDGTHARSTSQCRNGGELLDHFVDPLSFSYWVAGLAYGATAYTAYAPWAPWLGTAGVIVIYATAVLTSIRAKMIGEFTLARFGPTEFKSLLVLLGATLAGLVGAGRVDTAPAVAFWFAATVTLAGLSQLLLSLWRSVREVNALGAAPADRTEWHIQT